MARRRARVTIAVRPAVEADAPGACEAMRRSIRDLCAADHGDDPAALAAWLANKTPDHVRSWIASESSFSVVAVREEQVVGFGLIARSGELHLCYVHPEARFQGVSSAMLVALEERAALWGLDAVVLTSSLTARRFYERRGYRSCGEPVAVFGAQRAFPMIKDLGKTGSATSAAAGRL